jgi:hypothetical protein
VRGGSPGDAGEALVARQGWINGLHYDPNALATATRDDLLRAADMVRAGLAGSIRSFEMEDRTGRSASGSSSCGYGGQPAGYVTEPSEVVNYVENHDNQTLFDNNAFKLPRGTSREDRARVQLLGAAVNGVQPGRGLLPRRRRHAAQQVLDRNSYDSGDWFNRLDWTYGDNFFGIGLPPAADNGANWAQMQPLLADPAIKPTPADIAWTRDAFRDLLRLRASTTLLRLPRRPGPGRGRVQGAAVRDQRRQDSPGAGAALAQGPRLRAAPGAPRRRRRRPPHRRAGPLGRRRRAADGAGAVRGRLGDRVGGGPPARDQAAGRPPARRYTFPAQGSSSSSRACSSSSRSRPSKPSRARAVRRPSSSRATGTANKAPAPSSRTTNSVSTAPGSSCNAGAQAAGVSGRAMPQHAPAHAAAMGEQGQGGGPVPGHPPAGAIGHRHAPRRPRPLT